MITQAHLYAQRLRELQMFLAMQSFMMFILSAMLNNSPQVALILSIFVFSVLAVFFVYHVADNERVHYECTHNPHVNTTLHVPPDCDVFGVGQSGTLTLPFFVTCIYAFLYCHAYYRAYGGDVCMSLDAWARARKASSDKPFLDHTHHVQLFFAYVCVVGALWLIECKRTRLRSVLLH